MGFLDGMIGGMVGAAMVPVVNDLLASHGGVQGIVNQLQSKGLGQTVNAWVAKGPNPPVTPGEMQHAFGEMTLSQIAAKAGMSPQDLTAKLAQVLPHAVDAMTPDGVIPKTA